MTFTRLDTHLGSRKITELLGARASIAPGCSSWIIVGDFNVSVESPIVRAVRAAGFVDAYQDQATAFTCNPNGLAKRIDYLFHTPDIRSEAFGLPRIDDQTPLPSREEPSDHLAVLAQFDWAGT
jgi:endonuclease/exonuclease/phosphatase family metal-dependent hydrolase